MKRKLLLFLLLIISLDIKAIEISRIEPPFWWVGLKNTEVQLMVYGRNIARCAVQANYPGVRLKESVRTENPNYVFLYLEVSASAQPGTMKLIFTDGREKFTKEYELRERSQSVGAQGFNSSDVLYLLMPDRFANGDSSNDVWDNEAIDRSDAFGRHGGDFAGIEKHLDYLDDLGVTTIWLNPVLENRMHSAGYQSYHGYATTDFYRTDPRLGTNEDYRLLVEKIHWRGMKLVMDMIFNHCGSLHWWINDLPSSDWLNHSDGFVPTNHNMYSLMDIHAPESELSGMTDGWFVRAMPDLNQRNRLLSTYLIQNSIWWIEYAGVDGIRHDTHPYADYDFLSLWSKAVMTEYPTFNIVGEVWYPGSVIALAWWQKDSKLNSGRNSNLQTVMDFHLMDVCTRAFSTTDRKENPFRDLHEVIAQDFVYNDVDNLLVFLDNHDLSRFCKAGETDLGRYRQAMAFLLTVRGIPQLYYGTEILMHGEKRDGDGNLRKDFPGGWAGDPENMFTSTGRKALQGEAFEYLRKILRWRRGNHAVRSGKMIHYMPDWQTQCYVYARIDGKSRVLVILNGSDETQVIATEKYREVIGDAVSGIEIISEKSMDLNGSISIPGRGVYLIELN